jgi:hypothetical protein
VNLTFYVSGGDALATEITKLRGLIDAEKLRAVEEVRLFDFTHLE